MFTGGHGEMTADDVKFSFERVIQHDSPVKGDWGPLDHVEVTGKYSGVIVLESPLSRSTSWRFPTASATSFRRRRSWRSSRTAAISA